MMLTRMFVMVGLSLATAACNTDAGLITLVGDADARVPGTRRASRPSWRVSGVRSRDSRNPLSRYCPPRAFG